MWVCRSAAGLQSRRCSRDFEAFFLFFFHQESNWKETPRTNSTPLILSSRLPFPLNDFPAAAAQRRFTAAVPPLQSLKKENSILMCAVAVAVAAFCTQSRIFGLDPVVSPQSREIWSLVNEGMVKVPWKQFLGCLRVSLAMATGRQSRVDGSSRETHWPSCHT